MKKIISMVFCLLMVFRLSAQSVDTVLINKQVSDYIKNGQYGFASLLLTQSANTALDNGDLEIALKYQINNCELIEQNINFFMQNGLTPKAIFNNYGMVFILQRDLGYDTAAISTYLELANVIHQYSPSDLPFYANLIASTMAVCKEPKYADSVYHLQSVLDIIAKQPVTADNIRKYLWFCKCFIANRFFNSFNDQDFNINRIDEIDKWHSKNSPYIYNLDTINNKQIIVEYELDYVNQLCMFAKEFGSRGTDYLLNGIEQYNKGIEVLNTIAYLDDTIQQKIASCYAQIAGLYFLIGDNAMCKEYCDKTLKYLFKHKDNNDYCQILNTLALNYYNLNQSALAAETQLKEIQTIERLEGKASLSEWSAYFLYMVDVNPYEVINKREIINNVDSVSNSNSLCNYYMILGRAYSMLMSEKADYKELAERCFHIADSIFANNEEDYKKYGQFEKVRSNLYAEYALHYSRLNMRDLSYGYSKKAVRSSSSSYSSYYKVALKSAFLNDIEGIHDFLPKFYYGMETELCELIPTLGSIESDVYLANGDKPLYHIPEWASWNSKDTVCVAVAYDAALLMKGLTLRYNTFAPYVSINPSLVKEKKELDKMRDSLYLIANEDQRALAFCRYEQAEREILRDINEKMTKIHWRDVKGNLKEEEACIEFIKYTANAYSWSHGVPTPHYAAILLLGNSDYPVFVDLFDENELYDTYTLQPKSYDTEAGTELFEKLWGKLERYIIGKGSVSFSPMGMLNLINIEALADSSGVTALEKYNLTRVSSTRQIVYSKEETSIQSVISYGGIDYTEMAEAIVDSLNTRGNWNYLKNTLTEVRNVEASLQKNNIKVTTIIGGNATEASFKALDGTTANVIHIASHGFYVPEPQRETIPYFANSDYTKSIKDELFYSGLVMSGGQSAWIDSTFKAELDDGILTSYEISKLDLHNVDLVVLSACETGLGDNLFDGIFGLQRAFKKAGVTSILMSLWSINDKATSEYMEFFYNFLASGLSKRESYRRTVSEMRNRYQDANYWASFVLLD